MLTRIFLFRYGAYMERLDEGRDRAVASGVDPDDELEEALSSMREYQRRISA